MSGVATLFAVEPPLLRIKVAQLQRIFDISYPIKSCLCRVPRVSAICNRMCLQGRRIRGFEGARAPPERGSAPSHCQKHPLKMKENFMKHRFKPISIEVMVVLTFILDLYLCKTAVIHDFALN